MHSRTWLPARGSLVSDIAPIDKARLVRIRAAVGAGHRDDVPPPEDRDAPPIEIADESPIEVIDMQAPDLRWRAPDLAAEIERLSSMPWINLRLGDSVVVRARLGMVVALTAQTGGGKSSLALDMGADHARHTGPVVYISAELDADVVAARAVGQAIGAAWADVLSLVGVTAEQVARVLADLRRLIILDGSRATLVHAEQAIATMRAEHPNEPILLIADYLQVLPGEGREERVRVANIAESIRRAAQRLGVVVLAVSQTSRASSKGLRDGELVGADTTTTGAESSQIERMASVTIAIGGLRQREDGASDVDLSIGKSRFGGGDKVLPATYDGRTGRWAIVGPAVTGAEKRAERSQEKDGKRQETAALAILAMLEKAAAPMARADLVTALGLRRADVIAAVRDLIADPDSPVVEVKGRRAGPAWPVWVRHRADAAGIDIVPTSLGGQS